MRLQEVMSTAVETITADTSVAEAKTRMKREGIHHLVIGRGKRLIGVISSRDLSAALATAPVAELVAGKPGSRAGSAATCPVSPSHKRPGGQASSGSYSLISGAQR
jgi:CBS domain